MQKKTKFSATIDREVFEEMEKQRGLVSRSAYVNHQLKRVSQSVCHQRNGTKTLTIRAVLAEPVFTAQDMEKVIRQEVEIPAGSLVNVRGPQGNSDGRSLSISYEVIIGHFLFSEAGERTKFVEDTIIKAQWKGMATYEQFKKWLRLGGFFTIVSDQWTIRDDGVLIEPRFYWNEAQMNLLRKRYPAESEHDTALMTRDKVVEFFERMEKESEKVHKRRSEKDVNTN